MNSGRLTGIVLVTLAIIAISGCVPQEQYDDLKAQNRIQQQRLSDLESEVNSANLGLDQCRSRLQTTLNQTSTGIGSKDSEIAALEDALDKKNSLIAQMQGQLLRAGVALPMELSVLLQDFAKNNDIVDFDEKTGVLKFKSDLLFGPGSAQVKAKSSEAIKALCGILNTETGGKFDIIIAGHTDDQPIRASKARHATNWHLSAHRAIGVLSVMNKNGIDSTRLSVRGFGQFRPATPNKQGKKGTPANRRVEIYVVPSGA